MRISDWSSDVCSSDLLDGSRLTLSLVCTRFADDIIFLRHLRDERIALRITDQGGCDDHRPAGVQHMHHRPFIGWPDSECFMQLRRCRPTHYLRKPHLCTLPFLCNPSPSCHAK